MSEPARTDNFELRTNLLITAILEFVQKLLIKNRLHIREIHHEASSW